MTHSKWKPFWYHWARGKNMKKNLLRKWKLWSAVTLLLSFFGLFQNCGRSFQFSENSLKSTSITAPTIWSVRTLVPTNFTYNYEDFQLTEQLSAPYGIAIDGTNNVFISNSYRQYIIKITPANIITIFAGFPNSQGKANGQGESASFLYPTGLAVDPTGNIYVADSENALIREITPTGLVSTFAGTGSQGSSNGPVASATFYFPNGVALDPTGNVYVADNSNNYLRKIDVTKNISSQAGSYGQFGITVDASGNIYLADGNSHVIHKVTPAGVLTTFAGTAGTPGNIDGAGAAAQFNTPRGLTIDQSGNLYVADSGNHKIRKIDPLGNVSTIAGTGVSGYVDGLGAIAEFNQPYGVAVDQSGNLYVTDTGNNLVRKITPQH